MSSNLDLFCNEGPLIGTRIPLDPGTPLLIGRSARGINLPDPLVSIEHAELSWTTDRYYITDLGSQSGTFVDDQRLGRDEPLALKIGSIIRVGESTFEVTERLGRPAWLIPTICLVAIAIVVGLGVMAFLARPMPYEPRLIWNAPVRMGVMTTSQLDIPASFVRERGLDNRDLGIRRVTDYDKNEVDEVWLTHPGGQLVVTFDPPAPDDPSPVAWRIIGDLPRGCYDRPALEMPDQRCGGDIYLFYEGQYVLAGNDGPVAWMRLPSATEAPPTPYRFTLVEPERLAGFLSARGIDERVHYLICEEAISGLKAQVLTAKGVLEPLRQGCFHDIELKGTNSFESFGAQLPAMIAFTAVGREALLDDVTTYLSGAPDGMFLDDAGREFRTSVAADPLPRAMMRLSFLGDEFPVDPVADEVPLVGFHLLSSTGVAPNLPAPQATTIVVPGPGPFRVDPPGCSELEIVSSRWQCALSQLCMPDDTFLSVTQVGCGDSHLLTSAVFGGVSYGSDDAVEVRTAVETNSGPTQVDVLRTRVSFRVRPGSAP